MDNGTKNSLRKRISLIWLFLKDSKRYFVLAMLSALLMQILSLMNPKIIRFTIDSIIGNRQTAVPHVLNALITRIGGIPYLKQHFYLLALAVIAVSLCASLANFLYRYANNTGAEKLVKTMRDTLYTREQIRFL